ncbi:imidazole glycerol phosphate synthase subunit HisH [Cohnella sp. JJ-181]|uniref:imidazole glycerol phosphate synthase subunit HisH n=1 Tax=Cohnella rhizoplanae TaxID=2974897 RepID=UPI0022FFA4B2|nr:imidazole glycerol phosphate synthase subunit HisH [Cohnella sp. JJ-181]CAI6084378.1 Imidazole glycerol phosphate synthase subunit HisH [Cohnella sp. JJ-181]
MSSAITLIDYGIGNLLSVSRALEHCGADVELAQTAEQIEAADKLVLPGVGAFADGMNGLRERGLVDAIRKHAEQDKPLLGICLGMQMLLGTSEEFGQHEGLGIIPGRVCAIPGTTDAGQPHKIPHIGWTELRRPQPDTEWNGTVLEGIPADSRTYFVHSYTAIPDDPKHRLSDAGYNGRTIAAVIRKGSVYGTQFHPEKSRNVGLQILSNFIGLKR